MVFERFLDAQDKRREPREIWLATRREKLRERTRATVFDRALAKQTERCAVRRSGDTTLAVGGRLQAKAHADSRKARVVDLKQKQDPAAKPIYTGLAIPKRIARGRKIPYEYESELSSFPEAKVRKFPAWMYRGKRYDWVPLKKTLATEEKALQVAHERKETTHKGFSKLMKDIQTALQYSSKWHSKGIPIPDVKFTPATVRTEQIKPRKSVHLWKIDEEALKLAVRDSLKRRQCVALQSFSEAAKFAEKVIDDLMEMDADIDFGFDDEKFIMPSIQDFNDTPDDKLTETLRPFSLNLLSKLQYHVKTDARNNNTYILFSKWQILDIAIFEAKKRKGAKNNHSQQGNGNQNYNNNGAQQGNYR
jgi:hypothetical protein